MLGGLIAIRPRKGTVTDFFFKGSSRDSFVSVQVFSECGRQWRQVLSLQQLCQTQSPRYARPFQSADI